jgi:UDP-N-acetyl-D-mannosaminuronate dehydrogenase
MANRKTRKARRTNNGSRPNLTRQNASRRLLPKLNNGSQIVHNWMTGKTTPQQIARTNRNIRITYLVNTSMPSHVQKQVRNALNRFKATGSVYPQA